MNDIPYDVAIIGGGIAGLYAAYRLRQGWEKGDAERAALAEKLKINLSQQKVLRVVILEQNAVDVGGRIRSVEIPFRGGAVTAELGAMRLTSRHKLVRRLLHELDLRTVPFEGDGFGNHYYLRGRHFGIPDIQKSSPDFPYHLAGEEKGKTPDDLVSLVLEHTLRDLSLDKVASNETLIAFEKLRARSPDSLTHREWREIQQHGLLTGRHLKHSGMWNLIHHYLSSEAANFVESGFGYESIIGNWNVSDAIPWFSADFNPHQTYDTVEGGYARLLEEIEKNICATGKRASAKPASKFAFKCEIVLNARVSTLDFKSRSAGYDVNVVTASPEYHHSLKKTSTFKARHLILALPKRPLQELTLKWLKDEELRIWNYNKAMVRPHRLVKIVHAYRKPWWRTSTTIPGAGSRTFTDLPLRQLYYFDREWLEERGRYRLDEEKSKPEVEGLVLAYLDGHYATFWRFITAVRMLQNLEPGENHEEPQTPESAWTRERKNRASFGDRIWAWIEPDDEVRKTYKTLTDKSDAEWRAKRALHLYFTRYGLFQRASIKMTTLLRRLHKDTTRLEGTPTVVPEPVAGVYAFWDDFDDDPFTEAGWHTWESGVASSEVIKYMAQPFKNHQVFVCGEAYSSEQGWIEGALKSVELVMAKLGVEPPRGVALNDDMRDYLDLDLVDKS